MYKLSLIFLIVCSFNVAQAQTEDTKIKRYANDLIQSDEELSRLHDQLLEEYAKRDITVTGQQVLVKLVEVHLERYFRGGEDKIVHLAFSVFVANLISWDDSTAQYQSAEIKRDFSNLIEKINNLPQSDLNEAQSLGEKIFY